MCRRRRIGRLAGICGVSFVVIMAGARPPALAQAQQRPQTVTPAAEEKPSPCEAAGAAAAAGGSLVVTGPQRGWQMEGRAITLSLTPAKPAADTKPIVCFRWKRASGANGEEKFVQADSVQIQNQPEPKQGAGAGTAQKPGLVLTAMVPNLPQKLLRPSENALPETTGVYTSDGAAVADIRVVLMDQSDKVDSIAATAFAIVPAGDYCDVPSAGTRTDSGTVTPSASKSWQPAGGEIEFTVKAPKSIPSDALVIACFRWKLVKANELAPFKQSPSVRVLDKQPDSVKLSVIVPDMAKPAADRPGQGAVYNVFPGVSLADVRVLLFDGELRPVIDARTTTGVTSLLLAIAVVLVTVGIAFLALWRLCCRRLAEFGTNPLLCLITTRHGYASLSQFQIVLWTFVVIASAAYVIALSGDLIPITNGTLVLLGISGAATVVAKLKSESNLSSATHDIDPVVAQSLASRANKEATAAEDAAAPSDDDAQAAAQEQRAKADAATALAAAAAANEKAVQLRAAVANATTDADKNAAAEKARAAEEEVVRTRKAAADAAAVAAMETRKRHPRWSDLLMEEVEGREIDVTRMQMLFFTLVTAFFVGLKVATSYQIPEIPDGFLILMGISNGVYVGSKFASNPSKP